MERYPGYRVGTGMVDQWSTRGFDCIIKLLFPFLLKLKLNHDCKNEKDKGNVKE